MYTYTYVHAYTHIFVYSCVKGQHTSLPRVSTNPTFQGYPLKGMVLHPKLRLVFC